MKPHTARLLVALMIVGATWSGTRPAEAQRVLYRSEFNVSEPNGLAPGLTGGWLGVTTSVTPRGRYGRFLGEFGSQSVTFYIDRVPAGEVSITFSLLILRSWDGSQATDPAGGRVGPDIWSLRVDGGPVLANTTFSNIRTGHPGALRPITRRSLCPGARV